MPVPDYDYAHEHAHEMEVHIGTLTSCEFTKWTDLLMRRCLAPTRHPMFHVEHPLFPNTERRKDPIQHVLCRRLPDDLPD